MAKLLLNLPSSGQPVRKTYAPLPGGNRFWNSWPADLRIPYLLLLGLTLAGFGWCAYWFIAAPDQTFPWEALAQFDTVSLPINTFTRGPLSFDLQASGYLLTERYQGGLLQLPESVVPIACGLLFVALTYYLAAVSTLPRLPYVGGMLLFMLFAAAISLDVLGLIESTENYFLIGLLSLCGLLTYYFQAFRTETSFTVRLLSVALLLGGLTAFVLYRSPYDAYLTGLHVLAYGSGALMAAVLLFSIMVGFDNLLALLWLNGQGKTAEERPGLLRFLIASLLYLTALLLIYLTYISFFEVKLTYFTPLMLLGVSFLTGLWGFRHREQAWGETLPFAPGGAMLYLALALIAFVGSALAFAFLNDPLVEAFNDIVIFTHLGFGIAFLIYLLANFAPALIRKLPVYRVVYESQRIPFSFVYIGGVILAAILAVKTNFVGYYQTQSGYYNALGDLHLAQSDDLLASRYYSEANVLDNNNAKANLSLATIAERQGSLNGQLMFLQRTLKKRANPKVYARLGNLYSGKTDFFQALFTLREGSRQFPESHELNNNLALLFAQTSVIDSAGIYIDRATALSDNALIENNTLAMLMRFGLEKQADEFAAKVKNKDYQPLQSNLNLLTAFSRQAPATSPPKLSSPVLTDAAFGELYHYYLTHLTKADTAIISQIRELRNNPANEAFEESLGFLQVLLMRQHTDRLEARKQLELLAQGSADNDGYYYDLMGLWSLQEGLDRVAVDYFEKARSARYATAFLHLGQAQAFAGNRERAIEEVKKAMLSDDPELAKAASQTLTLLENGSNFSAPVLDSWAAKAKEMEAKPSKEATAYFNSLSRLAPYSEGGLLSASRYFNRAKLPERAYEVLLTGITYNPYSAELTEAYVWQALAMNLDTYAATSAAKLENLLPAADYKSFRSKYEAQVAERASRTW